MSRENVEILRTAYEAASARGAEGLLEQAAEDIVWISDPRFPGGGRSEGKQNVRRWLDELLVYEEFSINVEEIIDLDDGVLGIARCWAVPPDGPRVDWLWFHLVSFRDGLISQIQSFLDRAEASKAAGLSE
jgi:ketosteroid isomerase-like protein